MIAFGPVPSRRLGRSMGINNIPPKVCTYSCVYCQLGRTKNMHAERRTFYEPEEILQNVQNKLKEAQDAREPVDYLTFVPDGEPTLDINLGHEIELLKSMQIKVAVITNASLIWRDDVREALSKADWVSIKIDSTQEEVWRRIDRPYGTLQLDLILDGICEFAQNYTGELVTETMLIRSINDSDSVITGVAAFLASLKPSTAYLAIPTRPPAEKWVQPPTEKVLNQAYQIFKTSVDQVEYLIGYEGNAFAATGDVEDDLLSITAVHPMREEAVSAFLKRTGTDWATVDRLITQRKLVRLEYDGRKFYMRKLS